MFNSDCYNNDNNDEPDNISIYSKPPFYQRDQVKECNQSNQEDEIQNSEQDISTENFGSKKKKPYKESQKNNGIQFQGRELAPKIQKNQVYLDNQGISGNSQRQFQNKEFLSYEVSSCSRSSQKKFNEQKAEQEGNIKNQKSQNKNSSKKEKKQSQKSIIAIKKQRKVPKLSKKAIKKGKKYDNDSKNYPGFFKRYIKQLANQFGENWLHDNYPNQYKIANQPDKQNMSQINQLLSIEPLKLKFIQSIENDDLLFYILQSEKLLSISSYFEALQVYHEQLITTGIIGKQTIPKPKKVKI